MTETPHLSIVEAASDRPGLAVFRVADPRYHGPTPLLSVGHLRVALAALPDHINTVAFVVDPGQGLGSLEDAVRTGRVVGAARGAPVTEAIKEVEGDRVVRSVDRSALRIVIGPEVVRRGHLEKALADEDDSGWVSAIALVARTGGRVAVLAD